MKPKSLREYIKLYEAKTNDKVVFRKDYRLFYLADRGFMTCKPDIESKMLIIELVCGDGQFWHDFAEIRAMEMGLDKIGTFTNRPIEAYLKTFGAEVLSVQNIGGQKRFLCQDYIGRKVVATFKCDRGARLAPEYYITQYLNEKASRSWIDEMTKGDE